MSSFYIGYLPQAPGDVRKFLRRIVTSLFAAAAMLATIVALAQQKLSPAVFEYSTVRDFEGTLMTAPYPTLLLKNQDSRLIQAIPLVALGKHGFSGDLTLYSGKRVHLRAKRIYRDEGSMLEVMPGSIALATTKAAASATAPVNLGFIETAGEIVDTKCFLGVMNPGHTKVHRDCAARCLSGGVPPALLVPEKGISRLYLLANASGGALDSHTLLDRVAEPVSVRGTLWQLGDSYTIRVEDISRL